jgi:D-arabinose 1-dehydrogenase-like Zn-dependent alcohol dehydrogenase
LAIAADADGAIELRREPSLDGINEVFDRMERGQIDGGIVVDYR